MQNQHNYQQQHPTPMFQQHPQHPQQLLPQQGQPLGQPMYGFSQQGMAQQQFLAQQALQAGNRTAAPGLPQPQQLPGVAGMQLHRAQHQQMQPQQQAGAEAHFEGVDLDDIPSDIEDEVPAGTAQPAAGGGSSAPRPVSAVSSTGHMPQPMQLPQQQQPTHHLQPHTQHLALQQQRAQQHLRAPGGQAGLVHPAGVGQQLRAPHLPAANVNKHMSAVRPGQQLQQPRQAGVHQTHLLQQQQQQLQRTQQLVAVQQAQQQQQQMAAAAAAGKPAGEGAPAKRQKTADAFPAAPDDAQSLYEVLYKAEKAGAGILKSAVAVAAAAAAATAAGGSASVAAAAAAAASSSAADGPVTSVDDILRRAEAQAARAAAETAGRGRTGADKAADDDKLMSDSAIKRLLELQALNRAFKLQPDLVDQLQRLTNSFVSEAVKFGVDLASHRRGAVLRPPDLATYLERTHHLHVPGFTKEYHPYRRPAASELHKERSILVRKAQLTAPQAGADGPAAAAGRGAGAGGD